ncbi:hypothetical protein GGR56DRAFT_687484 [Xylariaceae sp. FL0804]|nr:hypothetical protein GGR56DRAFT_687484 [Xylariaceae sp. FL0804]
MTDNYITSSVDTWLSYEDLDHAGTACMPQLYSNLSKNASIPNVNGGILWADDVNKNFYLFAGEYSDANSPEDLVLYTYDVLGNTWESLGEPRPAINAVSYGAGVSISSRGEAYYYGGWISNNSQPGWTGQRRATNGLVKYEMDKMIWSNKTGPDGTNRAEGVMVYIPASDGGMLIYFGGLQEQANGSMTGMPMEQILIYDILSSRWYNQTATGDIPMMRSRFCAGVTWAPDQSSYNIYLYGGSGMPPSTAGFDDVYILSLPSFTWIQFYPVVESFSAGSSSSSSSDSDSDTNQKSAPPNGPYPHNTLSCDVIDGAQMLVVGGSFPLDGGSGGGGGHCDAPGQWATHALDLGRQNAEGAAWHVYDPAVTSYAVPAEVRDVVGGGPGGGATLTRPAAAGGAGGFDHPDLARLMTRRFSAAARTPTRNVVVVDDDDEGGSSGSSSSSSDDSTPLYDAAIAGIAIGGAAVLAAALLGGCWFVTRRRHRRTRCRHEHEHKQEQDQQQQRRRQQREQHLRHWHGGGSCGDDASPAVEYACERAGVGCCQEHHHHHHHDAPEPYSEYSPYGSSPSQHHTAVSSPYEHPLSCGTAASTAASASAAATATATAPPPPPRPPPPAVVIPQYPVELDAGGAHPYQHQHQHQRRHRNADDGYQVSSPESVTSPRKYHNDDDDDDDGYDTTGGTHSWQTTPTTAVSHSPRHGDLHSKVVDDDDYDDDSKIVRPTRSWGDEPEQLGRRRRQKEEEEEEEEGEVQSWGPAGRKRYSKAGFGPAELSSEEAADRARDRDRENRRASGDGRPRRHETYYHP